VSIGITEWEYREIAEEIERAKEQEPPHVQEMALMWQELLILRRLVAVKEQLYKLKRRETNMSIVRNNMLTRPGYTPYCGAETCRWHWPRTTFNGKQFKCQCGWQTSIEPEFIAKYVAFNAQHPGAVDHG
jgi:hypothetical protein